MSRLQRIAELARLEHYGKITPEQSAALAELRARAQQRGETLSQFISPMLTIGSAVVAEPVSGLAGIAGTVLPGEPGQGARWVQNTQDALTYQPKDEAGQRGVQAVADFFQPVGEVMDRATQAAGDAGYRIGGPALGAAAATIPTAVSELTGIGKPARAVNVLDSISDSTKASRISGRSPHGVDLYHGTDEAGFEGITSEGVIRGPAYFTPREDVAFDYSAGEVVKASIDPDDLKIDLDMPGGALMSIEDANRHLDKDDWTIRDYIDNGYSVGVEGDVEL